MNRKLNNLYLSFLVIFLMIQSSVGQSVKKNEGLFKLPEDHCLALNVVQTKSPVQFESIDILVEKTGKIPFINWKLKNNSSKTVKRFVIVFKVRTNIEQWKGFARGYSELDVGTDEKNDLILPYKTYQETNYEVSSPLPQEIYNLFSNKDESEDKKFVIVFGKIKKIVFNDESIYEADDKIFEEFLY